MSGGKGGEQTTTVDVPQWVENAARANLAMGERVAGIGYMPYYGPDVAAFSPMQTAAMQNTANLASAFGMQAPTDVTAGIPQAQQFAGGLMGYSSQPLFAESTQRLMEERPRQYAQYSGLYPNIEPYGIPSQEALSPVTGGTTARGFGSMTDDNPITYRIAPPRNPTIDQYGTINYDPANRDPSWFTEEEFVPNNIYNKGRSAKKPTTTPAPATEAQPAPSLTPRTDAEINELINQGLSKYQPTLPDLSSYARLSDIPTPQALPDVSKFATLEDVNKAIAGIPPAPVFDINPLQERLTALESRNIPTFDPSGLQTRLSALENRPIPTFDPSGLQNEIAANRALLQNLPQPSIPDVSKFATLEDVNRAISGIPQPSIPDVSKFATQADINRAIAGIPQPVMPTMEGLVTQEQLNRALAGLSAPVSIPNLGIGGMPQFRF